MSNWTKIKVRNLQLYYGQQRALKDIHLDVEEKRITALIGPSGCGKSSFLRTLNRMNDLITHNMQQAARTSDYTGFFLNGELVELAETETIFTKPMDKRTEDYITGRFG